MDENPLIHRGSNSLLSTAHTHTHNFIRFVHDISNNFCGRKCIHAENHLISVNS